MCSLLFLIMVRFNPAMQVLNKKEQKEIISLIHNLWGVDFKEVTGFGGVIHDDLAMFLSQKERIYLANRSVEQAPLKDIRINSIGCYFGEYKGGDLRLSIEGAQLIGPHATKNWIELNSKETEQWMKGETIIKETELAGFVLIKHAKDWLGCGKATADGRILNFVPKTRRVVAGTLPGKIEDP